jgi:hypothetical protein
VHVSDNTSASQRILLPSQLVSRQRCRRWRIILLLAALDLVSNSLERAYLSRFGNVL